MSTTTSEHPETTPSDPSDVNRQTMLEKLRALEGEHAKALAGVGRSTSSATTSAGSYWRGSGSSC